MTETVEFVAVHNFTDLMPVTLEWSIANGWCPVKADGTPDGKRRCYVEQWNNFNAEVAEAWEEVRRNRVDGYWTSNNNVYTQHDSIDAMVASGEKPEGFWVELADLLIRLADSCAAEGVVLPDVARAAVQIHSLPLLCKELVIALAWKDTRQELDLLALDIVTIVEAHAEEYSVDLWALVNAKRRYNLSRPYRHGNLKA